MKKIVSFENWKFEVDINRTKEVYKSPLLKGSADYCKCYPCQNFIINRENIYPKVFLKLLNELGIEKTKESEIYHICNLNNGFHMYGGWFHFKGKIIAGEDCKINYSDGGSSLKSFKINENFKISFFKGSALNYFEKNETKDLIQIEFFLNSKWTLDKKNEPE